MISIIIPSHNERNNLERLLPHLLTYADEALVEIIVALSCDSVEVIDGLATSDKIKSLKCWGKGRALQMNSAATQAMGDTLVFLHADVMPPKSFIEDIVTTLNSGYDAGFFSYRFDKESFLLKLNAKFTTKDGIFTGGGDQCLFIRKHVFLALGKFDEQQVLMEDFEFFDRMKTKQVRYKIIKNDLIVSARKYKNNSYVRVNLSNLLLMVLYRLGYPAPKLKMLHRRLIRSPS